MEIISSKEHTSLVREMDMMLFLIYFFNDSYSLRCQVW